MRRAAAIYKCVEHYHAQNLTGKIEALVSAGLVTNAQVAAIRRDPVGNRNVLVPPINDGVLWNTKAFDEETDSGLALVARGPAETSTRI